MRNELIYLDPGQCWEIMVVLVVSRIDWDVLETGDLKLQTSKIYIEYMPL